MKKWFVLSMALAVGFGLLFSTNAFADSKMFECTVAFAGIDDTGSVSLKLCPLNKVSCRKFYPVAEDGNKVLAVALTAMTSGLNVNAMIDWNNGATVPIQDFTLLSPSN